MCRRIQLCMTCGGVQSTFSVPEDSEVKFPALRGFVLPTDIHVSRGTRLTATPPFAFGLKSAPATLGSQPAPVPAQPAFNPESFVDGFKAGFDAGLEAGLRAAAKLQAKPATSTYDHFAPQPATFYLGTPAASAFSTFNFGGPAKPAFGGGGLFGNTSTKPATSILYFIVYIVRVLCRWCGG